MQQPNSDQVPIAAPDRLRAVADRNLCCGYGVCAEICPEVFGVDEVGIVKLLSEIVPAGLEDKAREAASACPQCALEIRGA